MCVKNDEMMDITVDGSCVNNNVTVNTRAWMEDVFIMINRECKSVVGWCVNNNVMENA